MNRSLTRGLWLVALLAAMPIAVQAASPSLKTADKEKPTGEVVDLFAAMKAGDIEVKVITKDSTEGVITIENKTKKPLSIKMPAAFAGVPVAAQFGGGGLGAGGGNNNNNANQGMGMGMMGGGMGGMGMGGGMGGGFFNVAPEKVAKGKFVAVCLDHGKKDPNPHVPYTPIPIESYAKDPSVAEVVKLLVAGQIDQHSAQAATWHLQNGLTWEELAAKIGVKHLSGATEPYFTLAHLERALAVTRLATERAKEAKESAPAKSIGEQVAGQQ
jgi:hypothetical protein